MTELVSVAQKDYDALVKRLNPVTVEATDGYEIQLIDGIRVRRKRQRRSVPAADAASQEIVANADVPAAVCNVAPDGDQQMAQSPSPEPEAPPKPSFENAAHLSATLRQACAEHAATGTQQHVVALCQHAFKQAAEHVRPESSSVAAAFDAMVEQCPSAIANVLATSTSAEAAAKHEATEHGISLLVNAEKARLRAALQNKREQRQHLLKLQEQVAEQRAALDIVRQQRERSAAMRTLQSSGVWQGGLKQAAPGEHPAQEGHTFSGPPPQPETDLTLLESAIVTSQKAAQDMHMQMQRLNKLREEQYTSKLGRKFSNWQEPVVVFAQSTNAPVRLSDASMLSNEPTEMI